MIHLQNEEPSDEISDWDELSSEMWLTKDDEYSYTNLLMNLPDPPLEEPIRRHSKRKVTLIELLEAFDLARKEAEEFQRNEKRRQEARQQLFEASRRRMIGTAHDDNIEADMTEIWGKICALGKNQFSLNELCDGNSRDEIIKTFVSVSVLLFVLIKSKKRMFFSIFLPLNILKKVHKINL